MEKTTSGHILIDYTNQYKSIMQFNKNKKVHIHQWYPFVEGYSKEFIESILSELDYKPELVLEPFSGSGTTPLEMQNLGIKCVSFEVSPFMHLLSTVKMRNDYSYKEYQSYIQIIKNELKNPKDNIREILPIPFGRTLVKTEKNHKWNFNDEVMNAILDIKQAIKIVKEADQKYGKLLEITLASILLEVSNLFRNGKCLSYKKNWKEKNNLIRTDVHTIFINKLEGYFADDIKLIESNMNEKAVSNYDHCFFGDVREGINKLPDNSIDLIITSPPYLNSRDYTDIYMLELKVLDLVRNYDELLKLRKRTLRSHVQVKYDNLELLEIPILKECIDKITENEQDFWNSDIVNMIKGYFLDINNLFISFKKKMKSNKYIYFNVANSAYFGIEVLVDEIVCHIAEQQGFSVVEIRKARNLKASSQQSKTIKSLRESVIVIRS